MPVKEVHESFLLENPDQQISLTSFPKFKPKEVDFFKNIP
jgi:hypothetical protein